MPIDLPTKPIAPTTTSPKSLVLYGPPKIGKTSIINKLPFSYLLIDCEDGSDHVEAVKYKVSSYSTLMELCKQLAATKPYECTVFDTIDKIEEWCESRATMLYKTSPQGKSFAGKSCLELPMGAGYLWLRAAFHEVLDTMYKSANKVILIGHVKDKMLDQLGKEVSAKDLDLTGKIKNILCSRADSIGYAYRDKDGKLLVTFQTKDTTNCGSRAKHLCNAIVDFTYPEAQPEDWRKIYND